MKMTTTAAQKLIKQLSEEKTYLDDKELNSCTYTAALEEEPVIPEYDYRETAEEITDIDRKIAAVRHAVNWHNACNEVTVDGEKLHIDEILVILAQLSQRKERLDMMRKQLPKKRLETTVSWGKTVRAPEYKYVNYDLELIKTEFNKVSERITKLQIALDRYNQTVEIEVNF